MKAVKFLGVTNPSMLNVFPVETDSATRDVEQEWMHHVHRRVVSRENRGSRGSEREASQTGLLPDLLHGTRLRILTPL